MTGGSDRLFVAFDVPDDVRALIENATGLLRERFPRARWVPAANQHVTVRFLGATPTERLPLVVEAVGGAALRRPAFTARTVGFGGFPSSRRARVLWVGLDDSDGGAAAIAAELDDALAPIFEPEQRVFTPHLTVARFDPPVALDAAVGTFDLQSRPFDVDALTLYRSHLGRGAPRYEAVETMPLARRRARGR